MKNLGLFIFCITLSISIFAQGDDDFDIDENIYSDITPKHSFTLELGLPVATANKPFKFMMQGLVRFSPYYQFTLKNHLAFGIGANYSLFRVNQFRVPEKVTGSLNSVGGFVKVGYEKFHSMRFGTDYGVKMGYNSNQFVTDSNSTKLGGAFVVNSFFVEPTVGFVLTSGEFTSYRFVLGYMMQGNGFNTSDLGINSKGGYTENDFSKNTQFMTFGFGFTYYFKQY